MKALKGAGLSRDEVLDHARKLELSEIQVQIFSTTYYLNLEDRMER